MTYKTKLLISCTLVLAAGQMSHASAGLVKLAESGDPEPNSTNTFFELGAAPTLSESGQLSFYTDLRNNGFLQGWGLFLADAQGVRTLARTGQPSPDLNGNFYTFNSQVALNSTSQVFEVGLSGTLGNGSDNSGLYRLDGGALSILARAASGTFRSFSGVTVRINRQGQVAFKAVTSSLQTGFYLSSGGTLARLAYAGQASPDGNGTLLNMFGDPSLNNNGRIAFTSSIAATNSSPYGLILADQNALTVLVRSGQVVPDGNGTFLLFPSANVPLNDADQIAFAADLTGTSGGQTDSLGLYRASAGTVTQLARKGQLVPGGNGRFLDFSGQNLVSLNNSGVVAFLGDITGTSGGAADNAGIFLADGSSVTQVARKGQPAPDGNGVFFGFHVPTINNNGDVAFVATLSGTSGGGTDNQGVYIVDSSHALKQVIRAGQVIGGKTVSAPSFLDGPNYGGLSGLNDNGQLAIWLGLNGDYAVFLWSKPDVQAGLRLLSSASVGADVSITFQAIGGTTNFVQAAPSPLGTFVDVGSIFVSGSGLMSTNYTELGAATNKARFYRIRQAQ